MPLYHNWYIVLIKRTMGDSSVFLYVQVVQLRSGTESELDCGVATL